VEEPDGSFAQILAIVVAFLSPFSVCWDRALTAWLCFGIYMLIGVAIWQI